jgi:hypothetical protein
MARRHLCVAASLLGATFLCTITTTSSAWTSWQHANSMCRPKFDGDWQNFEYTEQGPANQLIWPIRNTRNVDCGGHLVTSDGNAWIGGNNGNESQSLSCTLTLVDQEGDFLWSGSNSLLGPTAGFRWMNYQPMNGASGHFHARCSLPVIRNEFGIFPAHVTLLVW